MRMEQLRINPDDRVHMTCLKLTAWSLSKQACTVLGTRCSTEFNEDLGYVLEKACELNRNLDAVYLVHVAPIVRCHIIGDAKGFNGFLVGCHWTPCYPCCLPWSVWGWKVPVSSTRVEALYQRLTPLVQQYYELTDRYRQYASPSQARHYVIDTNFILYNPNVTCTHT